MSASACILMIFGYAITWGGAAVCIVLAARAGRHLKPPAGKNGGK